MDDNVTGKLVDFDNLALEVKFLVKHSFADDILAGIKEIKEYDFKKTTLYPRDRWVTLMYASMHSKDEELIRGFILENKKKISEYRILK